ncbi:MAG: TonB-dependent receptor, partial [Verrucomicrobiota bacterium]
AFSACIASAQDENEDVFELSPFIVESSGADDYQITRSNSGSIVAMDIKDLPLDLTSIGSNMIEDMGLYNADNLGEIAAGVNSSEAVNTSGGGGNTIYTQRGFRSVPRRGGFASGGRLFDMTSVERIDIIKGPNSVLYGQTDPGGIINYVPKRPQFDRRTHLTASYGSYDSYRLSADVMGAAGGSDRLAFRLPFSFSNEESDQDYYEKERRVVAPSILYRIGESTELFVETEFLRQEVNLADTVAWETQDEDGNWVTDYDKGGLGRTFNERGPNTYSINEQKNIGVELTTKIGEDLHLRAAYSYNERDSEIRNVSPGNTRTRRILRTNPAQRSYPAFMSFPFNRIKGFKADALYEKEFNGIRSRTLLGYERNYNLFGVTRYNTTGSNSLAALPNPLNGETITEEDYAWTAGNPLDDITGWAIRNGHPTENYAVWHNIRLMETLYMMEDRLVFMGGVADSDVRRVVNGVQTSPEEEDTTYLVGATFKATDGIVLFANHSTSFAPVYRTGLDDVPLDPSSGVGTEVGIKFDLFENRLFSTLTFFDLTNEGLPRQISADDSPTGESYWVNAGEEEARGVELSLNWRVNDQLSLNASALSFDGELVTASAGSAAGEVGQDLPRSPENAGQITAVYKFNKDGALKGLRFGLTASYKDAAPIRSNYTSPTVVSDEYTVFNGFIRYKLQNDSKTELFLNFRNLLDEEYVTANGLYGSVRKVNSGVSLRF